MTILISLTPILNESVMSRQVYGKHLASYKNNDSVDSLFYKNPHNINKDYVMRVFMDNNDWIIQNQNCNNLIMSEETVDLFIPLEIDLAKLLTDINNSCINALNQRYMIVHTPISNLAEPGIAGQSYRAVPKCYGLMDTYNLEEIGVARLRRLPGYDLYGSGVLIGFVDTGINYTNELFINRDGTTRIHSIWDQTINYDEELHYMGYGRVFTRVEINEALRSESPLDIVPTYDGLNHGTFIAAVAAGNRNYYNDFSGIAYSSEIVMVKLKPAKRTARRYFLIEENIICYQENDIAMGIKYLLNVSRAQNKPMVICLGVGTNQGGHDGNNILDQYLNDISNIPGICTVVSTGNEAGNRGHYASIVRRSGETSENVEIRVGEGETGFVAELWAALPQLYNIEVISPGGEFFRPSFSRTFTRASADFIFEGSIVNISNYIQEPFSGEQLIFIRFFQPSPGIWTLRVIDEEPGNTSFNMWLPIKQFLRSDTYFLRSVPTTTITGPGNAAVPITTAAYNHITRSIYINSGRGFTRSGRIKPDITAPGVNIYGPSEVEGFTRKTGTSNAAAETAGVAALLLEWGIVRANRPLMNTTEIKSLLIRGARRTQISYPNREWGYGILDVYGVFENLRRTIF